MVAGAAGQAVGLILSRPGRGMNNLPGDWCRAVGGKAAKAANFCRITPPASFGCNIFRPGKLRPESDYSDK